MTRQSTLPAADAQRVAIADLIRRYPDLTSHELAEVLGYVRDAPIMNLGVLASDKSIEPQYRALLHDYYISRPRPLMMWLGIGALVAIGIAALIVFPKFV